MEAIYVPGILPDASHILFLMLTYIYKVSMVFLTLHLKKARLESLSDVSRVPSQGSGASAFMGHVMQMPWLVACCYHTPFWLSLPQSGGLGVVSTKLPQAPSFVGGTRTSCWLHWLAD